jgi:hypothetical protein
MGEPEHDADVRAAVADLNNLLRWGNFGFYLQEAFAAKARIERIVFNLEKSCHHLEGKE